MRHITAVSGITYRNIIFSYFLSAFVFFFLEKHLVCLLLFLLCFCYFCWSTKFSNSCWNNGGDYACRKIFHLSSFSLRSVTLAGAGMLLFNPLLIHYDLGFQLSFCISYRNNISFQYLRENYILYHLILKRKILFIYKVCCLFMRKRENKYVIWFV